MPNTSGIYQISNIITGESYVGMASSCRTRRCGHFRLLALGRHHAKRMQESFDKYGRKAFVFSVLEKCHPTLLARRERYWIDKLKPVFNQNLFGLYVVSGPPDKRRIVEHARHVAARERVAAEAGSPGKCAHCGDNIDGITVCQKCSEWLKTECEDCHAEIAHGAIQNHNLHFVGSSSGADLMAPDKDFDAYH